MPPPQTPAVPRNTVALLRSRAAGIAMTEPGAPGYFPVLGIVASLVGMVAALATIPSHPTQTGALIIPALSMSIGLAVAPLAAGLLNPRNFLRTENIIGACPIYWLLMEQVQGGRDMPGVSDNAVHLSFVYVGLFGACFWLGAAFKGLRLPKSVVRSCELTVPPKLLFPIAVLFFVLGMQSFAIPCRYDLGLMYRSLFVGRFEAPWSASAIGGWKSFIDHFVYFGYLLPTLAVMQGRRLGWFNVGTVISIIFSLILLIFLAQGGGRRIIGVCVGAAVLYWLSDQKEVKWGKLVPAFLSAVALIWVMQAILYFRGAGFAEAKVAGQFAAQDIRGRGTATGSVFIHVDDNLQSLCQMVDAIPKIHAYAYHEYLFYVIVRPIPRALWENKPVFGGFDLGTFVGGGASLSSTILGELHLTLGIFAIIVGSLIYGMISRMSDPFFVGKRGSMAPMFHGYITMWLFVGFRSLIEVMLFAYPLLAWMLVARLFRGPIEKHLARAGVSRPARG